MIRPIVAVVLAFVALVSGELTPDWNITTTARDRSHGATAADGKRTVPAAPSPRTRVSSSLPARRMRAIFLRLLAVLAPGSQALIGTLRMAMAACYPVLAAWLAELGLTHAWRAVIEALDSVGGAARGWHATLLGWRRRQWRHDRAVSRILRRSAAEKWYCLLQVRRKASPQKLKAAYRRLAKRVHPDKTDDDRASLAFNMLREAYDLLADKGKRKRYDAQLAEADLRAQLRREQRRAAAVRLAQRAAGRALELALEHRRATLGLTAAAGLYFIMM